MRILMVAAEAREFAGILARAKDVSPLRAALDWARRARLGEHEIWLAANGAGCRRAAAAVEAVCGISQPEAVVSTGFCGALDAGLEIASVVVATEVADARKRHPANPVTGSIHYTCGMIRCSDQIAATAAEKKSLAGTGACAVEMEAAGVAQAAQALALPFYCVRAVTDLACETMANDFQSALRPDGHFATMIILGSSLRYPFARIPELVRLRTRCGLAARALGDFFADCRF
jgi:nucleoside phosphorylase